MMFWRCFRNDDGSSSKIETMSKKEVGKAISMHKKRMKSIYLVLYQLHDRFHKLTPERPRPDTRKVFLKSAGMRADDVLAYGKSHVVEKTNRMEAIINLCLQLLDDESDLEVIRNCLMQAKGEMQND